jgi:hypothetical protein
VQTDQLAAEFGPLDRVPHVLGEADLGKALDEIVAEDLCFSKFRVICAPSHEEVLHFFTSSVEFMIFSFQELN